MINNIKDSVFALTNLIINTSINDSNNTITNTKRKLDCPKIKLKIFNENEIQKYIRTFFAYELYSIFLK